jgi:NADPH:quinone reductase-like Zn-dependent oxidoreductase
VKQAGPVRIDAMNDWSVLVAGGAGAVGHYAVQFARLAGAEQVIATMSSALKAGVALDAGAHAAVNYQEEGWSAAWFATRSRRACRCRASMKRTRWWLQARRWARCC